MDTHTRTHRQSHKVNTFPSSAIHNATSPLLLLFFSPLIPWPPDSLSPAFVSLLTHLFSSSSCLGFSLSQVFFLSVFQIQFLTFGALFLLSFLSTFHYFSLSLFLGLLGWWRVAGGGDGGKRGWSV